MDSPDLKHSSCPPYGEHQPIDTVVLSFEPLHTTSTPSTSTFNFSVKNVAYISHARLAELSHNLPAYWEFLTPPGSDQEEL